MSTWMQWVASVPLTQRSISTWWVATVCLAQMSILTYWVVSLSPEKRLISSYWVDDLAVSSSDEGDMVCTASTTLNTKVQATKPIPLITRNFSDMQVTVLTTSHVARAFHLDDTGNGLILITVEVSRRGHGDYIVTPGGVVRCSLGRRRSWITRWLEFCNCIRFSSPPSV